MLSWEDYHKEETTPVSSAALSIPTEPEQSIEPVDAVVAAPMPIAEVSSTEDPMAKAIEAVQHIDVAAGLEELEMGAANFVVLESELIMPDALHLFLLKNHHQQQNLQLGSAVQIVLGSSAV